VRLLLFLRNRTVTRTLPFCNLPILESPHAPVRTGGPGVEGYPRDAAQRQGAREGWWERVLPWWVLLAGLAASAFAAYVLLGCTQAGDSPWVLFPLTAALAPVIFLGAALAGITL
jgi:hypothetical protein